MAGSAWTNQVQNQVIVGGANGRILVYSGTPAAGNLIGSSAGAAGTDLYGNNYVAGDASYSAAFATALNGGQVTWYSGSLASGWTSVATATAHAVVPTGVVISAGGEIVLTNTGGSARLALGTAVGPNVTVLGGAVSDITAGQPGAANTIETWHTMTLLNSWTATAGRVAPQYRKLASPPAEIEVIGSVTAPAGLAGASNIWALPSGYQLADGPQPMVARNVTTNAVVMMSAASGSGNLSYQSGAAAADVIDFHGFFSLDA